MPLYELRRDETVETVLLFVYLAAAEMMLLSLLMSKVRLS